MGMKRDRQRRNRLVRTDQQRRVRVSSSLDIIFKNGQPVNCAAIEMLLQEESWVATAVS